MSKHSRRRMRGGLLVVATAAILFVGIAAASMYENHSQALLAAAAGAQCYGGDVYVFSRDFNGMPNSEMQAPEVQQVSCYPMPSGSTVVFKESQMLTAAQVCARGPHISASACGVTYYAVVPDYAKSKDVYVQAQSGSAFNPVYDMRWKLSGENCSVRPRGFPIQFGDCAAAEAQVKAAANADEEAFCQVLRVSFCPSSNAGISPSASTGLLPKSSVSFPFSNSNQHPSFTSQLWSLIQNDTIRIGLPPTGDIVPSSGAVGIPDYYSGNLTTQGFYIGLHMKF